MTKSKHQRLAKVGGASIDVGVCVMGTNVAFVHRGAAGSTAMYNAVRLVA